MENSVIPLLPEASPSFEVLRIKLKMKHLPSWGICTQQRVQANEEDLQNGTEPQETKLVTQENTSVPGHSVTLQES